MPTRPMPGCRTPGCPGRAARGGFCAEHYRAPERKPDRRPSAARRGYDAAWGELRDKYLAAHPECCVCGEPAVIVDHIQPLDGGGLSEWANLESMCARHHARKHASERRQTWTK